MAAHTDVVPAPVFVSELLKALPYSKQAAALGGVAAS